MTTGISSLKISSYTRINWILKSQSNANQNSATYNKSSLEHWTLKKHHGWNTMAGQTLIKPWLGCMKTTNQDSCEPTNNTTYTNRNSQADSSLGTPKIHARKDSKDSKIKTLDNSPWQHFTTKTMAKSQQHWGQHPDNILWIKRHPQNINGD